MFLAIALINFSDHISISTSSEEIDSLIQEFNNQKQLTEKEIEKIILIKNGDTAPEIYKEFCYGKDFGLLNQLVENEESSWDEEENSWYNNSFLIKEEKFARETTMLSEQLEILTNSKNYAIIDMLCRHNPTLHPQVQQKILNLSNQEINQIIKNVEWATEPDIFINTLIGALSENECIIPEVQLQIVNKIDILSNKDNFSITECTLFNLIYNPNLIPEAFRRLIKYYLNSSFFTSPTVAPNIMNLYIFLDRSLKYNNSETLDLYNKYILLN